MWAGGGLADCFDERHSKYAELKALLTEEEYAAARESTLTAFYTPPVVIRSIYQALTNMGFKTGNILEPSCGIGNFIGMRPEALADSKIYGVELDGISGRIAQQLYQQSSIAVQGFEKTDLPDSFFDAAIGNVPFGSFKVIDKRYDRYNFLIHDYFFARTLDKVRPGGVIAFVTSKGTMDKDTPHRAEVHFPARRPAGAIRLPNNTFKDAAGTEVTSDILFLQKRDALSSEEPDWVHLNTDANGLKMNQYFIDHPEMVMGEMREVSGPYGPETACLPIEGRDLGNSLPPPFRISKAPSPSMSWMTRKPRARTSPSPRTRRCGISAIPSWTARCTTGRNSRMNPVEVSVTAANRIKGLIGIRDCVRTLIEYQTEDWPDQDIQAQQREVECPLRRLCGQVWADQLPRQQFRVQHGQCLFPSELPWRCWTMSATLSARRICSPRRTIKQRITITHVDTASEALAVSLAEKGKGGHGLYGGADRQDRAGGLRRPDRRDLPEPHARYGGGDGEKYLTADEYLSGNVREKLEWAKRERRTVPEGLYRPCPGFGTGAAGGPDRQRDRRPAGGHLAALQSC